MEYKFHNSDNCVLTDKVNNRFGIPMERMYLESTELEPPILFQKRNDPSGQISEKTWMEDSNDQGSINQTLMLQKHQYHNTYLLNTFEH